jgi:AraC-like DNA-binding protein
MSSMTDHGYALDTTWRTLLKDMGVASADVLRRAGLAEDLFEQPATRLAPQDYYRLWNSIEAQTEDPAFPVQLCHAVRAESFSPPLFAALCSPDFVVAASRISQYKKLVAPFRFDVVETTSTVAVELSWPGQPAPPTTLAMMELLFVVTLMRTGTREPVRPVEVSTTTPPREPAPYEEFLGVRLHLGPRHRVVFAAADARRPFLTSNEPLWQAFEPGLRRRLADLDAPASTAERIRAALLEALPSGQASIDTVARKLSVSKRTLQRRIEAEGTSYQQILDDTRTQLAYHYLENTALTIGEIAFLLGYTEPNSFYRAFRVWTGSTPDAARHAKSL